MSGEVIAADLLVEPLLMERAGNVVVVPPLRLLVASIVGRVDVDALDLATEHRQQRLEGQQVVTVDDQVVLKAYLTRAREVGLRNELTVRHRQVIVLDDRPALKLYCWHACTLPQEIAPAWGKFNIEDRLQQTRLIGCCSRGRGSGQARHSPSDSPVGAPTARPC